ncbi:hypothetical protein chiPu_0000693 [Chiloscyllium punctatum]|uniref:Uncharacterized protein n=1 Tax=Chiloscyllium punctatum TaxID=137246 RepID=A0A401RW02_CHIPU|nr:hypothetical protein [Chiloscyllium punctatum]
MATKLPTREEFESWRPRELAEFLRLNNLSEPASVVERQKISGTMFLNSLDLLQNRFNVINYPFKFAANESRIAITFQLL